MFILSDSGAAGSCKNNSTYRNKKNERNSSNGGVFDVFDRNHQQSKSLRAGPAVSARHVLQLKMRDTAQKQCLTLGKSSKGGLSQGPKGYRGYIVGCCLGT